MPFACRCFGGITDYVIPENRKSNNHSVDLGKSGNPRWVTH